MGSEVLTSQSHPSILFTLSPAREGHLDKVPSQEGVAGMGGGATSLLLVPTVSWAASRQREAGLVAMSQGTILLCLLALLGHPAAWQRCWAWAGAWDGCWEPGSS